MHPLVTSVVQSVLPPLLSQSFCPSGANAMCSEQASGLRLPKDCQRRYAGVLGRIPHLGCDL